MVDCGTSTVVVLLKTISQDGLITYVEGIIMISKKSWVFLFLF